MYVSIQFPFHSWKTMENQGLVRVFSFIFILKLPRSKQPLLLNSNHWLTLAKHISRQIIIFQHPEKNSLKPLTHVTRLTTTIHLVVRNQPPQDLHSHNGRRQIVDDLVC